MSEAVETPFFEAVILPHRSLSARGRQRLIGALCLTCGVNAGMFIRLGAWPVGGFTGIELLLAALLLHINARRARASEVVLLSAAGLRIVRTDPRGVRAERLLPAAWLRLTLEEIPGRVPRLLLHARDQHEEIATSLGEAEKRDLAASLAEALHRWRNPLFDNPQLRQSQPREAAASSSLPSERIRS